MYQTVSMCCAGAIGRMHAMGHSTYNLHCSGQQEYCCCQGFASRDALAISRAATVATGLSLNAVEFSDELSGGGQSSGQFFWPSQRRESWAGEPKGAGRAGRLSCRCKLPTLVWMLKTGLYGLLKFQMKYTPRSHKLDAYQTK
jgi:hypothetical protein